MESFSRAQRDKYILPIVLLLFALLIQGASQRALAEGGSDSPDATARPVTINFDSLPTNVILSSNQYQIASFSTDYQYGANIDTIYDAGVGGSYPNGIESVQRYYSYIYNQSVYVNFAIPVSGLTFRVLNGILANDISSQY